MAVGFNIPNGAFPISAEGASGMPDWAKAMSQGFQGAADVYKPRAASEKLLEQMIKNKFLPRSEEARIGLQEGQAGAIPYMNRLHEAQTREAGFYADNPLLKLPGAAGQIGAMNYLKNHPEKGADQSTGSGYADMIAAALKGQTAKNTAAADYSGKRAASFAYSTAPVDAKNYLLAQAAGMGIAPDKAVNAFSKGETIEDLAMENGFDPENLPEPDFMPTRGNVTSLNQRKAALGEMKHLSDFVTDGLGPYASTVMGWSPEQLSDQLNNMNPEKQVKFLAARGLVPELTNMRLMTAGAKTTVAAIKDMKEKSMLNIKAMQTKVNPKVWVAAQKLMDKELEKAMGASTKAYHLRTKNERNAQNESSGQMIEIRNNKTGITETVSVEEARRRGVPNV